MPQTFEPSAVLLVKLVLVAFFATSAVVVVVLIGGNRAEDALDSAAAQPIPFSHKHHVGDVGLDCRFCHVTVETNAVPGMPSAQLCLTCHSQLFADQSIFEPLRQSVASGLPIGWKHVYRLPDYVYFDHSVHVAKNVACIECHGRIDQMPLVEKTQALHMRWCVSCHENPAPHLHPAADVFSMRPAQLSEADVQALNRLIKLESRQRLTDCSTCHR